VKLADLEPHFLQRRIVPCHVGAPGCDTVSEHTQHEDSHWVDAITEADGIGFLCPKCFAQNAGPKGTHHVICWRPRVPADVNPKPGGWEFEGTGYADLSLVAGSSSVLLQGGCNAHFMVTRGEIEMLP
jgi:hypothetical protein